jgi:hypothetical protein
MKSVGLAILLLALLIALPTVFASGTGLVVLQIQGYGIVRGQLQNTIIQRNDTIAMPMVVNDQIQTSQGSYPVVASGVWSGLRNGSSLSGLIQSLKGKIRICFFMKCGDVDLVGRGNWTGALDSSAGGKGTFAATLYVRNSPYPQIPIGEAIPVYGSWTADFAFPIPEFSWHNSVWLMFFVIFASLVTTRIARNRKRTIAP